MTDHDDLIRLLADMRSGPCRDDIELARDVLDEAADAIRDLRAERDALRELLRDLDADEMTDYRKTFMVRVKAALAAQEKP
jgi:hypothetical protein